MKSKLLYNWQINGTWTDQVRELAGWNKRQYWLAPLTESIVESISRSTRTTLRMLFEEARIRAILFPLPLARSFAVMSQARIANPMPNKTDKTLKRLQTNVVSKCSTNIHTLQRSIQTFTLTREMNMFYTLEKCARCAFHTTQSNWSETHQAHIECFNALCNLSHGNLSKSKYSASVAYRRRNATPCTSCQWQRYHLDIYPALSFVIV